MARVIPASYPADTRSAQSSSEEIATNIECTVKHTQDVDTRLRLDQICDPVVSVYENSNVMFMTERDKRMGKTRHMASPRLVLTLLPILTGALSFLLNWLFR